MWFATYCWWGVLKLALCLAMLVVLCLLAAMLFVVTTVNSVVLVIDVVYCGW